VSLKKERGSSTPFIEWQMIEFPFNANQRQASEKKAMAMGVDSFVLKPDGRCNQSGQEYVRGGFCPLLWFSLAVECDGQVSACLINDDDSLMVGDLHTNDVVEIWNSEAYRHLRASVPRAPENGRSFCQKCNWFDQGNPA